MSIQFINRSWFGTVLRFGWLFVDFFFLNIAYFGALLICNNLAMSSAGFQIGVNFYFPYVLSWIGVQLILFVIGGIYRNIWSFASIPEFLSEVVWNFIGVVIFTITCIWFLADFNIPNGLYPLLFIFDTILLLAPRLSIRISKVLKIYWGNYRKWPLSRGTNPDFEGTPTMIIGAGYAGRKLLAEIGYDTKLKANPVVIIDDDPLKKGMKLDGVPIIGGRDMIPVAVRKYHVKLIILSMPSCSNAERQKILEICNRTKCRLLTVPSLREIVEEQITINQIREVKITDLLGREESLLNLDQVKNFLSGKVILVSGGGGSIGSELCRQIANFAPKLLVVFDIYENNAYDLQQELKLSHPDLPIKILIGSVRDLNRMDDVFAKFRPEVVFHAAAHKHVPLMEDSPKEAIKNNVFGTYNTAISAKKWGAKRFVLISTDKAVNPTNVMGASKRLCEMVIQSLNEPGKTEFAAVRFGNVLGSNGSVIPLFTRLIKAGKPLPVTHPDIVRYFMTIPEAARLVLQAGAMAKGGEIFILDMGKPVKIVELAENLIRLSGLRPYEDIPIEFCGLRPGEKLYEELNLAEEGQDSTTHEKIFISHQLPFDYKILLEKSLPELNEIIIINNEEKLREYLQRIVTTYHPASLR